VADAHRPRPRFNLAARCPRLTGAASGSMRVCRRPEPSAYLLRRRGPGAGRGRGLVLTGPACRTGLRAAPGRRNHQPRCSSFGGQAEPYIPRDQGRRGRGRAPSGRGRGKRGDPPSRRTGGPGLPQTASGHVHGARRPAAQGPGRRTEEFWPATLPARPRREAKTGPWRPVGRPRQENAGRP